MPTHDLSPISLGLGDLAYWDCFNGLIPVKIILASTVDGVCGTDAYLTYRTTAVRPGWSRGESRCIWLSTSNRNSLVPRKSVYTRNGQYRIRNNWHWLIDGQRHDVFRQE